MKTKASIAFGTALAGIAIYVCVIGAIVYVAAHFIMKFW